ncbi:MAG: ABC transporter permease, partial [Deltaproteobacteria bacterium]
MWWETFMLALRAIRRNALRSGLTVLGIVIGVAAVITMVTLGGGATAKVTKDIGKLGSNMLQVRPGQGFHGPGGARASAEPFEVADAEALAREIADLEAVAPAASRSMQVIRGNENRSTTVTGTTDGFIL